MNEVALVITSLQNLLTNSYTQTFFIVVCVVFILIAKNIDNIILAVTELIKVLKS